MLVKLIICENIKQNHDPPRSWTSLKFVKNKPVDQSLQKTCKNKEIEACYEKEPK